MDAQGISKVDKAAVSGSLKSIKGDVSRRMSSRPTISCQQLTENTTFTVYINYLDKETLNLYSRQAFEQVPKPAGRLTPSADGFH
jgi:hypothetical protein